VLRDAERDVDPRLGFLSESHGFLPRVPPPLELPESHRAWDEAAARLPELWRTVSVREALAALPVLDADALPDESVWRASCLLGILAHSYVRVETRPAGDLPPSIQRPWDQLARRLGRPRPFLSYNDLILANWRLRDAGRPDPMRVENLDLLVPTVGNREERVFYLTQVEIVAQCAPVVGAVVRAQEAAVRGDRGALETELLLILERLRHVTEVSFPKIDPRPGSATYVDPVVWATTVAPFAVPIGEGTAGPSGTAAPIFHLLDVFFGRRGFESFLGREALDLRTWFPPRQQQFLEAAARIQVREHLRDDALRSLFATALDAYAGPRGYLGQHRQKVYGYLELAFKVGRSVTIGGFSGAFRDRAWQEVDEELERARRERLDEAPADLVAHAAAGAGPGTVDASELALLNDDEHGYRLAIDGGVYDVAELLRLHPGGPTILLESVGLDATREYRAVLHHERAEIEELLPGMKAGAIRRLDLGPLHDLFRAWVRYLYLVVEMENALRNDFRFLREPLTAGDEPGELNALKVQLAANTHQRFLEAYYDGALGADLQRLFGLTVELCAPDERADRLQRELAGVDDRAVRAGAERARTLYLDVAGRHPPPEAWEPARRFCELVEEADRAFLAELKLVVREGVRLFERHEAETLERGAGTLVGVLLDCPEVARRYCRRFGG
jgi:cytochrome b involved in lipid metabolism